MFTLVLTYYYSYDKSIYFEFHALPRLCSGYGDRDSWRIIITVYSDTWGQKTRAHFCSALKSFSSERDRNVNKHGPIFFVAVLMRLLPSRASNQPILVGQVVNPTTGKTIATNLRCPNKSGHKYKFSKGKFEAS